MEIDSPPVAGATADDAPRRAAVTSQRASALALAFIGLLVLIDAQLVPWFRVRPGSLFTLPGGQDPATVVRPYRLADLSGAATPLYVGWVVLFGLFVVAWVRAGWRRTLLRVAVAVDVVLAFVTFDLARTALGLSGFREQDYPTTEFRSGVWLAVFGAVVVTLAVAALAAPPRVRADSPATPSATATVAGPPQPAVATAGTGWSARPVWVPWWRRRGPVTALVIGVAALVVVSAMVVWAALHKPPGPRDHSGDLRQLLVAAPTGSTPGSRPSGTAVELGLEQAAELSGDQQLSGAVLPLLNARRAVADGWTEPDGTAVTVVLLQCGSDDAAATVLDTYQHLAQKGSDDSGVADVPGLPGARSFVGPARDDKGRMLIHAVAQRGDIVFLITEERPGTADLTHIGALAARQYDQL